MEQGDYLALLRGVGMTIALSVTGVALGLPLGLGMALIRWRRVPVVDRIVATVVSVLRATPAVTLGLLVFFALPGVGISLGPITAAIVTLTVNTSAFNCEIWRGALIDFPREQIEAAQSVGMTAATRFRRVVLPQVVRAAAPALVSEMTLLVKGSPAVAVLGVVDLTRAAVRIGAATYEPMPPFMAALAIYVIVVSAFVGTQRLLERRMRMAAA